MSKEIEKRVFLTDDQYKSLIGRFGLQSEQPERQITTYYDAKDKNLKDVDLRLMQTINYAKLWMKRGEIHDVVREESEVRLDTNYASAISKILRVSFMTLKQRGLENGSKHSIKRQQFALTEVLTMVQFLK